MKPVLEAKKTLSALYIRVSTEFQAEEGYSIDAQKQMLASYNDSRNFGDFDYYIDGGFTGSNMERPELSRLISDIKDGKVSRIIVYKLDRLSRSLRDTMYLIEDVFLPHNVDFISINESFDTSTPFGRACIAILSVFAQLERENIYMRTRMGMKERVKSGLWMGGGRIPFGYDYNKEEGILVPNDDAETVRKIYSLYLQGYSTYKISNVLGFSCERLIIQILQRKSNCGYIVYNGEEYKGKHDAIIDEETYNKTVEMIRDRSRNQMYITSEHLLTGLVECGVCGAKMRYQNWGKKSGYRLYCYSHQKSKKHLVKDPNCNNVSPRAADIENLVLDTIFKTSLEIADKYDSDNKVVSMFDELIKQKSATEHRLRRLYSLYAGSVDDALLTVIESEKIELSRLEKAILLEEQKSELEKEKDNTVEMLKSLSSIWEYSIQQERKQILSRLIEKVIIDHETVRLVLKI